MNISLFKYLAYNKNVPGLSMYWFYLSLCICRCSVYWKVFPSMLLSAKCICFGILRDVWDGFGSFNLRGPMVLTCQARTKFQDARTTQPMSWQEMQLLGDFRWGDGSSNLFRPKNHRFESIVVYEHVLTIYIIGGTQF
jgi:hypothetical protein